MQYCLAPFKVTCQGTLKLFLSQTEEPQVKWLVNTSGSTRRQRSVTRSQFCDHISYVFPIRQSKGFLGFPNKKHETGWIRVSSCFMENVVCDALHGGRRRPDQNQRGSRPPYAFDVASLLPYLRCSVSSTRSRQSYLDIFEHVINAINVINAIDVIDVIKRRIEVSDRNIRRITRLCGLSVWPKKSFPNAIGRKKWKGGRHGWVWMSSRLTP